MAMNENGGSGSWLSISLRKIPSMTTLGSIIAMAVGGVWWLAGIQRDVSELLGVAKVVDVDSHRIDALSWRQTASDGRVDTITASITGLTAEFHTFVHEQDVADRRFGDSLAEIKSLIGQVRTDLSWIERGTGPRQVPASPDHLSHGER